MQCGICRIPFKLEYFGNDGALIQIYENKIREHRNLNNNNELVNVRISQSNRAINNNNINIGFSNRQNDRDIQLNALSQNTDNTFIILFHPNKFICIATLIVNILRALDIKKKSTFNDTKVNSFLWIYLIFVASVFYLSSIYVGIFHNFIYFNPRKIKNKEKGICLIILNILMGGFGTIFYGIIAEGITCCERIKMWIIGITQVFGLMFLIITISIFSSLKIGIFAIFIIIGFLSYFTSIYLGIKLYKRMNTY